MAKQKDIDKAYMKCAHSWAEVSRAERKKVGAIVVKDGIMSPGFNGMPPGFDNDCEDRVLVCRHDWRVIERLETYSYYADCHNCNEEIRGDSNISYDNFKKSLPECSYELKTKKDVLHAEWNSLDKVGRSTLNIEGATLYVTLSPCHTCALRIISSKISRVVYDELYEHADDGLELLAKAGIQVDQVSVFWPEPGEDYY